MHLANNKLYFRTKLYEENNILFKGVKQLFKMENNDSTLSFEIES